MNELCSAETRENALIELRSTKKNSWIFLLRNYFSTLFFLYSRKRESFTAPMLWHSFGSIAALLQEVISVYQAINPPTLTVF